MCCINCHVAVSGNEPTVLQQNSIASEQYYNRNTSDRGIIAANKPDHKLNFNLFYLLYVKKECKKCELFMNNIPIIITLFLFITALYLHKYILFCTLLIKTFHRISVCNS